MAERTSRKEAIAELFAVNPRTVQRWAQAGCPHSRETEHRRGGTAYLFNSREVGEWLQDQGRTTLPGRPVGADQDDLRKAKLQLTIERALLARIQRQEAEGKLHDVEECRLRRLRQIHAVKSALLSLPRSVAPELMGKTERKEIETILEGRMKDILWQFAGREGESGE
jgi:phage terminase Nu1 subunit (DNA packaging protein)